MRNGEAVGDALTICFLRDAKIPSLAKFLMAVAVEEGTKKTTVAEAPKDVPEEKAVNPTVEEKADGSKALVVVEKVAELPAEKKSSASADRGIYMVEKLLYQIKLKFHFFTTLNRAIKNKSSTTAWENSKKASIEADLRKAEEKLEKKKAEYAEKKKNRLALLHKAAEDKRAMIEAKRGEDVLKAEETAAKFRATGLAPTKIFGCFGP
ncbi:uncharacterized protein A4U43_C10F16320 [Asparagus officinalis]|uniref:Remorin C-terminal domain-containing protein n=1 Tax=Asparagus officinalis TaxID=4686 RepID=A0A5P1E347_ASPOF|nr:uncharacterized protein A4U43_C10F16320 [Asparagus officinalis]